VRLARPVARVHRCDARSRVQHHAAAGHLRGSAEPRRMTNDGKRRKRVAATHAPCSAWRGQSGSCRGHRGHRPRQAAGAARRQARVLRWRAAPPPPLPPLVAATRRQQQPAPAPPTAPRRVQR
jgi:hypothetical protein